MDAKKKPKKEPVRCLGPGCDKTFLSRDRAGNRMCPACSRKVDKEYVKHAFRVNGDRPPQ